MKRIVIVPPVTGNVAMTNIKIADVTRVRDAYNLRMIDALYVTRMFGSADAVFADHDPEHGIPRLVVERARRFEQRKAQEDRNALQGLVDAFNVDYVRACVTSDPEAWYSTALLGRQIVNQLEFMKIVNDDSYTKAAAPHEG